MASVLWALNFWCVGCACTAVWALPSDHTRSHRGVDTVAWSVNGEAVVSISPWATLLAIPELRSPRGDAPEHMGSRELPARHVAAEAVGSVEYIQYVTGWEVSPLSLVSCVCKQGQPLTLTRAAGTGSVAPLSVLPLITCSQAPWGG